MEIRIRLAGEEIGPFSAKQVQQYLGEGLVSPSDQAIHEGLDKWEPIHRILSRLPPPNTTAPAEPALKPPAYAVRLQQPSVPDDKDASKKPEMASAPPPENPVPPPTASQPLKRKQNKIVIQPILPLEVAPSTKKKNPAKKPTLTLEPLRPTTALPPVTGSIPKETPPAKPPPQSEQLSLKDFSEKPASAQPVAKPTPSEPLIESRPTAQPLLPPARTSPKPSIKLQLPPPLPPQQQLATAPPAAPPELPKPSTGLQLPPLTAIAPMEKTAAVKSARFSRQVVYAGYALAFVVVCLIVTFFYFVSANQEIPSAANPVVVDNPSVAPDQPGAQIPEATSQTAADYLARGMARQAKGDLDAAIDDYDQALNLAPKDLQASYQRGLALQTKGDWTGALADYNTVLSLNPKSADAFSNRGFVKQAQGDLDGALADYAQALLLNPKIPAAYYNVGLIKAQKADLDGAIAAYDQALDLDPNMAIAYYNRGYSKNAEGNLDGAIADYTQALTLNPKIARAYCDRGFARQSKHDPDGALADYAQAIDLDPKMAVAYYNRGLIKVQKGDLDGAIDDNTQAIDLDPKNGQAYCNRGLARLGKNDLDDATADLKKFCELAPRDTGVDSARLYLWLIASQQNPKGDADLELAGALQNDWNSSPEDFSSKIAAFLLGHIRENDLIANAATPDLSRQPGQYCKAWYFAGMKRLLAGDTTAATDDFQKCLLTQQKDYCEYLFAQAELQTLGLSRETSTQAAASP